MVKIHRTVLEHELFKVNAMAIIPDDPKPYIALFTHGYTSNKSAITSWGQRLSESDVPVVLFDLPGHFMGSYNDLNSFEDFTGHAHELFKLAYDFIRSFIPQEDKLIIGGHSLGALMSIKALELFKGHNVLSLAVGFGLNPSQKTHLFDTPLYQKTLEFRNQLVSEHLDKDRMFGWIKEQKEHLRVSNQRIHLLCGQDDMVVGKGGVENLASILKDNDISIEQPKKMPHHQPDLAAPHIHAFLKKEFNW
jgi:hypothetical protein